MRDLARSLRSTGQPVPVPWTRLGRYLKPRTQSVMIVLAASGVGKSTFALNWALELGEPALYLSLDTALVDHAIRVIARGQGRSIREIEQGHDEDLEAWADQHAAYLESLTTRVRFCDQSMRVETIGELVAAETEYWGEPPKLVIVDNLMNLVEGESAAEYRRVIDELLRIAKTHHTLVVGLHHLRKKPAKGKKDELDEDDDEGTMPVRLHDALYPVDQEAKYVIGLWRPNDWDLKISILKNRMGESNANARVQLSLAVELAKARVFDKKEAA